MNTILGFCLKCYRLYHLELTKSEQNAPRDVVCKGCPTGVCLWKLPWLVTMCLLCAQPELVQPAEQAVDTTRHSSPSLPHPGLAKLLPDVRAGGVGVE